MANKFSKFSEYIDNKGKLEEKPIIDASGDTGPDAAKTPETPATKGKNWKTEVPLAGQPKNYTPSEQPWKPGKTGPGAAEKGFADEGDKDLIYNPKTQDFGQNGGKQMKSFPTVATTEQFLDQTKKMSLAEFTKFISDQNKIDKNLTKTADPIQNTIAVGRLACQNDKITETFVREMKRNGAFDKLFHEIFKHPEAYKQIALMINDENMSKKIERAMREVVDTPAAVEMDDKKPENLAKKARKTKTIAGENLDMQNSDVVQTRGKV